MVKIICALLISTNIENTHLYTARQVENNNTRIKQYVKGIKQFFHYNENNFDVLITDNTIPTREFLNKEILSVIPKNCRIITSLNNKYGSINKGSGIIEQWNYCKDIIKDYDFIIHFEPRQLLQNNNFINDFLGNPRNLLTIGKELNHFNTGLFCLEVKHLFDFIDEFTPEVLVINKLGLEYALYYFFMNNKIPYDSRKKMDLIWFPTNESPIEM